MDTELLATLTAIAKLGTMTAAATELRCSQSAMSRRVAQLESAFAAPLFERTTTGMTLTAAGRELLPYAHAALAAIGDGHDAVRSLRESDTGQVTIALVGTLAGTWLTDALRAAAAKHPAIDLRLRTGTSLEVAELVRAGEAAFAVGYGRADDRHLQSIELFQESMIIVCAATHQRAGRPLRSLSALRAERWLAFPDRQPGPEPSVRHVRGALAAAGIPDDNIIAVDSLTAQKRMVEAGFGIAAIQATAITEEVRTNTLAVIPTRGPILSVPVLLTRRRHGFLSRAASTCLNAVRQAAAAQRPAKPSGSRPEGR